MPQLDPATRYATDVVEGRVVAGRLVRLAAQRHLNDLAEGEARGLRFDPDAAQHALDFFGWLRLSEGEWDGKPFVLQPWQEFIVGSLFGWKKADGYRRFRTAYCEIGKGAGKSPLAAGIGLYGLLADGEASAEIYSAATSRDQAGILFRDAKAMVNASVQLAGRLKVDQGLITHERSGSLFKPVSSEHRGLDGKRVHIALIDELHEHPSALVVDKMRLGTKGRRQAMIFEITNSGYDRESVCWRHHEYSENVLLGRIPNDGWFAFVCGLDPCEAHQADGKTQPVDGCKECDDWRDEKVWQKANPNLGVSIREDYLREQVTEAEGMPSKQGIVKRLNFCRWCVAPDTLVTMADGTRRPASELAVGDVIMAFDEGTGKLVRASVRKVADNGTHDIWRVTTARGRVVSVTGNHRFWARTGRTDAPKYGWLQADELKAGSRVAVALGDVLPRGGLRMKADHAYLLGVMTGDGTCVGTPKLTNTQPAIVAACNRILARHGCELAPQSCGVRHYARHTREGMGNKTTWLRHLLKLHGLNGKTCFDKRAPRAVFKGGANVWAAFLSGYMDADGDITRQGIVRWTSVNRALLGDCQHLLALLGVQGSVNCVPSEKARDGITWRLEVRTKSSIAILKECLGLQHPEKALRLAGLDVVNQRHGDGVCPEDIERFDRVVKVEVLPPAPTVGIEVEGVHTHVTEGLITHNTEAETAWLSSDLWARGAGPIDWEEAAGRKCYGGLDAASTTDVAAFVVGYPDYPEEGQFALRCWLWIPRAAAEAVEHAYGIPYSLWEQQGLITIVDGEVMDYALIEAAILRVHETDQLESVGFDPWNTSQLCTRLMQAGVVMHEFRQTLGNYNEPCKRWEALLKEGKLRHGDHAVLTWMAGNVSVLTDASGNIRPIKPTHGSPKKIDGVCGGVMSLGRAMADPAAFGAEETGVEFWE